MESTKAEDFRALNILAFPMMAGLALFAAITAYLVTSGAAPASGAILSPKGDVLAVAGVAGIQASKRTAEMIPLCHPLLVGAVYINFEIGDDHIAVEAQVDTIDRTGVEMEALHACSVAALTIYDMCKSADREMVIGELTLWEKSGGRQGLYRRENGA